MFPGFANKKIIFLNDRHEESDTAQENRQKLYDKRIFPLLKKNDLAVFGDEIDPFLWEYYRSLGLGMIAKKNIFYVKNFTKFSSLTKAVINNSLIIKLMKQRKPDLLVSYILSKNTKILARKINTRIISNFKKTEYFNNKFYHRKIITKLGFPVIPGLRVSGLGAAKVFFQDLKKQGFKQAVMKKERSIGGYGVFVVSTEKGLEYRFKKNFRDEKTFILEGFIDKVAYSPNVQYWVGAKKIKFIGLSDQLFEKDKVSQIGNYFPSSLGRNLAVWKKVEAMSYKYCRYLKNQNYIGLVGIDYLISENNDIYSLEANCRFNYSTFPALIAQKLFGTKHKIYWKTFTLEGHFRSFQELFNSASELFITKKGQFGVFPLDVGILKTQGEGQFMAIASTLAEVEEQKTKLHYFYENLS